MRRGVSIFGGERWSQDLGGEVKIIGGGVIIHQGLG